MNSRANESIGNISENTAELGDIGDPIQSTSVGVSKSLMAMTSSSPLDLLKDPNECDVTRVLAKESNNTIIEPQSSDTSGLVYHGVRKRSWGKWVCEIREPRKKTRIWLGSYPRPDMAARAYDVAAHCLKGKQAHLNFPDLIHILPRPTSTAPRDIQAASKAAASLNNAFTLHDHPSSNDARSAHETTHTLVPQSCDTSIGSSSSSSNSSRSALDIIHAFTLAPKPHDDPSTISCPMTSNKLEHDADTRSCQDGMVASNILHSHEHPDPFIADVFSGASVASLVVPEEHHYWHVIDQLVIPESMSVVSRQIISVTEYALNSYEINRYPSHGNGFDEGCTVYQDMLLWDY